MTKKVESGLERLDGTVMIYGAGQARSRLDSRAEDIDTEEMNVVLRQAVTAELG